MRLSTMKRLITKLIRKYGWVHRKEIFKFVLYVAKYHIYNLPLAIQLILIPMIGAHDAYKTYKMFKRIL